VANICHPFGVVAAEGLSLTAEMKVEGVGEVPHRAVIYRTSTLMFCISRIFPRSVWGISIGWAIQRSHRDDHLTAPSAR
jgi:hypothetical protein